jgi:protein SCO1
MSRRRAAQHSASPASLSSTVLTWPPLTAKVRNGRDFTPLRSDHVNPRVLITLFLLAVFALGAIAFAATRRDDNGDTATATGGFQGARMPPGVRAPDFRLQNQDGDTVTMRSLRGRPAVVTFLYTTCEDTCPIQAQTIRGALDQIGHDLPALAIAVDPPRDTPQRAKAFLSEQHALGRIDFVLGSRQQLKPLWDGFFIRPQSITEEHQARITLVDAKGYQRVGFPGSEATPERIAHDLRLLEQES